MFMLREDTLLLLDILEKLTNYGQVGRITDKHKLKRIEAIYKESCRDANVSCKLYLDPITCRIRVFCKPRIMRSKSDS